MHFLLQYKGTKYMYVCMYNFFRHLYLFLKKIHLQFYFKLKSKFYKNNHTHYATPKNIIRISVTKKQTHIKYYFKR